MCVAQSWTFHHPNFNAHKLDKLMHIKRKPPVSRAPAPECTSTHASDLQSQLEYLSEAQAETSSQIRNLDLKWQDMRATMSDFQRNIAQQDQLMQALAQNFWHPGSHHASHHGMSCHSCIVDGFA